MRRILPLLLFLALAGQALAQPVTTQPSVNNMTLSQCGSSLPLLGNGVGVSTLACGTISGNTTKFMTGSGAFVNGDVAAFDANGNIVDGGAGSGGGTALADEAAFTQGSTSLTPIGGFYQPNSGTTNLTAGQAGSVRLTPDRFFLTAGGLSTTTGSAWTSGTGSNATQTILGGYIAMQAALVQLDQTTTLTGGAVTWEGTYDGINWVSLATSQVIDPTSASGATIANPYTFQASTNKAFLLISSGFQQLRMRLSTTITGSGSVTPYIAAIPYNALGNGAQKTQIVDGSGNVIASTSNNLNVQCANCSGSGVSTADQASFTAGSSLFAGGGGFFQTTATSNPLTTGQQGMFQVTAQRALFTNLRNASGTEIGTASNPVQVSLANTGANATAILVGGAGTAGSQSGGVLTVQGDASMTALLVNPKTIATWGLMSGTTPGTAPTNTLIMGGIFNSSAPAPTNGQTLPFQLDSNGYLDVDLKSAIPAGANTIGAVTQASGPWTENLTQVASNNVVTAANGVQRVGIAGSGNAVLDAAIGAATAPTNGLATLGIYNNATPPAPTDGQSVAMQLDQAGNLRNFPGIALKQLSAWSSGTTLNTAQTIYTNSGASAVLLQFDQTTTLTGGAINIDLSFDNTANWTSTTTASGVAADQALDPTSPTLAQVSIPYTVQASTNKPILVLTHGASAMRIRLSTVITGTGTVTPYYALLPNNKVDEVIAFSPTAANFNVTATLGAGAATIGSLAANQSVNVAQVNGNTTSTAATGVQKVGIVGNAGGVVDAATGGSIPANGVLAGVNTGNALQPLHVCGTHVTKHITTAADTQLVAASGATTIYICDYEFSFNGTGNAFLEKATTGTCATLTQIAQTWYGVANLGKTAANPYYRGLNTGASAQLCVNTSQAVAFDITVYYDQY